MTSGQSVGLYLGTPAEAGTPHGAVLLAQCPDKFGGCGCEGDDGDTYVRGEIDVGLESCAPDNIPGERPPPLKARSCKINRSVS
mmetsp:Transcript_40852/g.102578  ORF Transcript_40852/g.102578 Transcript_40852/m.102578 type:complete len:84 (+) Transcript_40852:489-740(+)|eukprot:CAMPEP_0115248052 /NCGR_PEP_ID=MMETSP0270-20121206/41869_1 /TAXON_ID=71861 /ORGANISM="Scrippsiella trochoidea, Strain CCMP3099" /LENGTH=83 /DNA_ID=CAMNT_0002663337 /DNA_START=1381 /DNA_END=1632 /DNA_ORIENTATION=-